MITVGMPSRFASSTGRTRAFVVEGGEHDPVHALAREALHHLDLLLAVVLAERPLPDDLDRRRPRRRGRAAALIAPAWMLFQNSWVVPFGNDRDPEGLLRSGGRGFLSAGSEHGGNGEEDGEGATVHIFSTFPVFSSKRTRASQAHGRVRDLSGPDGPWPTCIGAFGVFRLRMQSSQLREVAHGTVALRAHRISGSGVFAEARPPAVFVEDEQALPVDLEGRLVPAELEAAVVDAAPYVPVWVTMKSFGYSRVAVTVSGHSQRLHAVVARRGRPR